MSLARSYVGATAQQQQWTEDAINGSSFPWDRIALTVEFHFVPEADFAGSGHFDKNRYVFGDTHLESGTAIIRIWDQLDTKGLDEYEGKDFFGETVIHELGHGLQFTYINTNGTVGDGPDTATLVGLFHDDLGRRGTVADWDPSSKLWEQRIIEAFAEFFKDVFFDGRKFDDRTDWRVDEADFLAWINFVGDHMCAGGGGGGYEQVGTSNFPGQHNLHQLTNGRYYSRLDAGNTFGPTNFTPSNIAPGPWYAVLPHLYPLTRIRDNVALFGILDPDTVYWGYFGGSGDPATMTDAVGGQAWTDWPDTLGTFDFHLADDLGTIGDATITIDPAMSSPDAIVLSIDPGARVPISGFASVSAKVPDGDWQEAPFTPFAGLHIGEWDTLHNFVGPAGPFTVPFEFGGGVLAPVKGACDPLQAKWPYVPHEYDIGSPDHGHILHHRPITGHGIS